MTTKIGFSKYIDRPDDYMFIIEADQKPVGQIGLYNITDDGHSAEFGRLMIGEKSCLGKGVARAATTAMLAYAFEALRISRVFLEVRLENAPAIGLYRSLGFMQVQEANGFCADGTVGSSRSWYKQNRMLVSELIEKTEWHPPRGKSAEPTVTVVLPTFRRGQSGLFAKAVSSVLNQQDCSLELLIVDDCSTDGTIEQIQDFLLR